MVLRQIQCLIFASRSSVMYRTYHEFPTLKNTVKA